MRYLLYALTHTENDEILEILCEKGLPDFIEWGDLLSDLTKLAPPERRPDLVPIKFYRKCVNDIAKYLILSPASARTLEVFARHFMARSLTSKEVGEAAKGRTRLERKQIYKNVGILNKHADGFKQLPLNIETVGKR